MTFICCVPGCRETGKRIFHSFPKNESQCRNWIVATKCFYLNKKTAWKTHNNVCRKHFQKADFKNWNLLKKNVVPSLLLPHIITMEHDYCGCCERNSIRMPAAETCNENDSAATTHSNGSFDATGEEHVSENGTTEAVDEDNNGDFVMAGDDFLSEKHAMEVDKEGCKGDDVNVSSVRTHSNGSFGAKEENQTTKAVEVSDGDIVMVSDGFLLEKDAMEGRHKCGDVNDYGSALEVDMLEEENAIDSLTVDRSVRENSKPKSSRTYNPAARKIRYLLNRNRALANKLKDIQATHLKSNKKSKVKKRIEVVLKTLSETVPPEQYNFVKLQIRNAGRRKRGNRFTFDEKTLALAIYKPNPKRYRDLLRVANLPCRRTLITHMAAIRFKEGVNPNLLNYIKEAVSQMDDIDKVCTIGWDEMSLSAHLDFEQIKDYIDGFEDLESKRTNNFATHALVFMIRGLKSKYKQPFSYFLTGNIDSTELAELIRLVITAVQDTGKLFVFLSHHKILSKFSISVNFSSFRFCSVAYKIVIKILRIRSLCSNLYFTQGESPSYNLQIYAA